MKKFLLLIAILGLLLGAAHASSSGLNVGLSKYEPFPAEPGKYLEVWISIKNIGNTDIDNAQIKITPNYPFSIDSSENNTIILGALSGGQEKVVRYKVRVDQNAVQGENFLDVSYKYGGYDWLTKRQIVFVQTHDAILSVKKVSTEPASMVPGQVSTVFFELENMADSFLSDITLKLDLSNSSLPFSPIDSTTEKRVYLIESQKTEIVEFNVMALPDAESGVYKIPIEISYSDGTGADYSRTDVIGLVIGDVPKIEIYVDESSILNGGSSGVIQLIIINKGLTDIKFLNIELLDSDEFEKISTDTIYMGNLDSDDTDTVEFRIYAKPTNEKTIVLPINAVYLDANNNEYQENVDVELKMYSSTELSRYGLRENSNNTWILVLIFVAGAGYLVYKKVWKRR